MSGHIDEILYQLADLQRRVGNSLRMGTVHEVKGDKMRVNWGQSPDGKPVLSPWISTHGHNGGARERRFFKKGQNVMIGAVDADYAKAFIISHGPNKNFKKPDHANKSGQGEETYQQEDLRVSKGKDGYDIWLEEPEQQQGQAGGQQDGGQGGGQSEQEERKTGGDKARVKIRLHNDGGVTARVGSGTNAVRFSTHKEGVKMKVGKQRWAVITPTKHIVSHPWELGPDPVKDDDK